MVSQRLTHLLAEDLAVMQQRVLVKPGVALRRLMRSCHRRGCERLERRRLLLIGGVVDGRRRAARHGRREGRFFQL